MRTSSTSITSNRSNHTPRVIALGVLAILFLLALARASAQTAEKAIASPAGVYTLTSVDGKNVPCTIDHDGKKMEVQSGTFTVSTNGQITSVMTVSVGDRKNLRIERTATYTMKNSELTMKWQNAGMTKGRVAERTLITTNEGMAYVYQK